MRLQFVFVLLGEQIGGSTAATPVTTSATPVTTPGTAVTTPATPVTTPAITVTTPATAAATTMTTPTTAVTTPAKAASKFHFYCFTVTVHIVLIESVSVAQYSFNAK